MVSSNNNFFENGIDMKDNEFEIDRTVVRSYVPYKEKNLEQPSYKLNNSKNFRTEIGFRKKLIPLEEIVKLDLELIAELAKARAEIPKESSKLVSFF